jgi:tetratricopeptide (TPR) repeat protein
LRLRPVALALALAAVLLLGWLQLVASVAVRDRAARGSWLTLVPPALASRIDDLAPEFPLPAPLRLLLARRALEDGNVSLAAGRIALLPPSRDRSALAGGLAQARGDAPAAARAYLAAGDLAGVERLVAGAEQRGDADGALALQNQAVQRLRDDRTQSDTLAEAYYRLGILEEEAAGRFPLGTPMRREHELRSQAAYNAALVLAPLSQRYLVAAGSQELNLGDLAGAMRHYQRARNLDPISAVAVVGLGEVALRRGDAAAAGTWLDRARALAPADPAVLRLAQELERAALAGELAKVDRQVAAAERRGDPEGAVALQRQAVQRLRRDGSQNDALAEAYYRLGILEEEAAWRFLVGTPTRHERELRSQAAYDAALALAPSSLGYLIAAGSQELNLGDLDAASRDYLRVHELDPSSAVALVGLGEVAFRRGDAGGARAWLNRARALAPADPALLRLAQKLGQ